ncbi:MAG: adenosine kinase [Gammaproteobacteria bacterium]|nr:adenosine kinase [Gammaproteobacteria bacterium]
MKQFQVYGIGNALVDIDFEVSKSTLERLNIAKGVMTLIDESTHHRLLEELDGVKHLKACGGSAANTLFTVQQLGAKTFYSCKVGDDAAGDFFYQDMIAHGIHTNLYEIPRHGVTGKCIVMVTPDADRTMNTFLGVSSSFSREQLSETALKNSDFLYIEGYLVASPLGCEAAMMARQMADKYNIKTAITLSDPNMVNYFKEGLCAIIGNQVDLLFANESEALLFTGTDRLDEAKETLKKYAKSFVITLGGRGALIYDGHGFTQVDAYKVPVLDTVGAGDVFAGTFLYAITKGYSYYEAGKLASFAASKVVSKFGPRLTDAEIDEVRQIIVKQSVSA